MVRDRNPRHSHEVHLLKTTAGLDPRSARKALRFGPDALRGGAGVRARLAMDRLGILKWEPELLPIVAETSTVDPKGGESK